MPIGSFEYIYIMPKAYCQYFFRHFEKKISVFHILALRLMGVFLIIQESSIFCANSFDILDILYYNTNVTKQER